MILTGIFIYPVKSLRGVERNSSAVDDLGLVGDRRFLIVDADNRFLTQRTLPRMALIETALSADALTLAAPGAGRVSVPLAADPAAPLRAVSVWKSEGLLAEDCGKDASAWLENFLGQQAHLVRIGHRFERPILKAPFVGSGRRVAFADAYPFLVISEASLADLNDRLLAAGEEPVPMNRFRPNLVVGGVDAFAEDTWTRFRIGDVSFRCGGRCGRCIVTTTDQTTGERGPEPLRTLARYRRDHHDPTEVNFGQNLVCETSSGSLRVGDRVELLP